MGIYLSYYIETTYLCGSSPAGWEEYRGYMVHSNIPIWRDERMEDIAPFLYNFTINFTSASSLWQMSSSDNTGV